MTSDNPRPLTTGDNPRLQRTKCYQKVSKLILWDKVNERVLTLAEAEAWVREHGQSAIASRQAAHESRGETSLNLSQVVERE